MILVTGGTGFIGSHLLEKLTASNRAVRCLARPRPGRSFPAGVDVVAGDLALGQGIDDALRGVNTVFHLAGVTKALRTEEYYAGNAQATENLAAALRGRDIRLVHVSSLAAIGPSRDGKPVCEDAEPRPISQYGRSKLEAERIVRRLAPDAVIVRPPVVYGPGDTDVFQLLKSISKGWVLEIAGGERWFSAIYVRDLVDGLIAAAGARGRTYFIADPKPLSWSDFGATAARLLGRTPRVLRVPVPIAQVFGYGAELRSRVTGKPAIISRDKIREARCEYWTCDTRRAQEELGFEARTGVADGLRETLAWYKEAGWLA